MAYQQVIEINIQRYAGKAAPLAAEPAFHFKNQRMAVGETINLAVIDQAITHGRGQRIDVHAPGKVAEQVADRRFDGRLCQYEVCKMIHTNISVCIQDSCRTDTMSQYKWVVQPRWLRSNYVFPSARSAA